MALWVLATMATSVVVALSGSERPQAITMGAFGGLGVVVGLLLAANVLGGAEWLARLELGGVLSRVAPRNDGLLGSRTGIRLLGLAVAAVGVVLVVAAGTTLA